MRFENAFKRVIPSLKLLKNPTKLIEIDITPRRLLFRNENTFITLVYPHPTKPEFGYRRITNSITTASLIDELKSAYFIYLASEDYDVYDLIISDLCFDSTSRQLIVKLLS